MDDADRTSSTAFEVPTELRPVLQHAADAGLERACEHSNWNDNTRDRVLEAARLHMAFSFDQATFADIATLADSAITWTELPATAPTSLEALDDLYDLLSTLRELIVLRGIRPPPAVARSGRSDGGVAMTGEAWHVARTMRALELLATTPLSAPQLAAALDTHPRTMRRVLERLTADGWLTRSGDARRIYAPTMRLVALATQTLERDPVARRGRPHVALLHARTGAAAHLVVPSYQSVVCISHTATDAQDEQPHLRELVPAHCTAGGKVLLAYRDAWCRSLLAVGLKAFTDRTITDADKLRAELAQIRLDGHANEDCEYQDDVQAIGAPVLIDGEVVAAVSASGRHLDIDTVIPHVLRAARDLTGDPADAQ